MYAATHVQCYLHEGMQIMCLSILLSIRFVATYVRTCVCTHICMYLILLCVCTERIHVFGSIALYCAVPSVCKYVYTSYGNALLTLNTYFSLPPITLYNTDNVNAASGGFFLQNLLCVC